MSIRQVSAFILMALVTFALTVAADDNPDSTAKKCSSDEFRQFDFWIGHWALSWGEGEAAGSGTNIITAELDDCVIEENFSSHGEQPFVGHSVSVYSPADRVWRQTWVDNNGGYLDFEGRFEDGRMILAREAVKDGQNILQRMVWYNIERNSLDWNWERSLDKGATWEVLWKIHYQRYRPANTEVDN